MEKFCYFNTCLVQITDKNLYSKKLLLWGWSVKPCWFQWHNSFTPDGSSFPLRGLLLFPLQPLLLTVCALSMTVAAISHILFILGVQCTPLSPFLNVGSAAVRLRAVCLLVCCLGYKRERRKQEARIEEKPHHREGGSQYWVNNKDSFPVVNLTNQR